MATLGRVADWGSGGTPKRGIAEYFGDGTPWVSIADLNDGVVDNAKESLTAAGIANSAAKIVPAGTIFIAMYGSIGKLGIAGREMCTSQAIAFAKPDFGVIDPRYLFHYLLAQRPALLARGRGGTQQNISQGDLKNWPIPVPILAEQRRIAAILDQQVLAHLDSLTQSIFHKMFHDSGAYVEFGEVIARGPTNGLYRPASDYGSGTPILRIDGFDRGVIHEKSWKRVRIDPSEIARFALSPGDIIINRVNALFHLGKSAIIAHFQEPSVFESNMMRITVDTDRALPGFVIAWLQTSAVKHQILRKAKKAINQASINQADVSTLRLPLPPRPFQQEFVDTAARVRRQGDKANHSLWGLNELFESLRSRAFRGEL